MAGLYSPVLSVSAGYPDHVLLKVMGNGKADQLQSEDTFKTSACVMYPYIPLFKARCYRRNVWVPLQIHLLKHNAQCASIRGLGIWEVIKSWGWAPMNLICVLIRDTLEHSLTLSALWGYRVKIGVCEPGSWFSPVTKYASFLTSFRTVRNEFLLFITIL